MLQESISGLTRRLLGWTKPLKPHEIYLHFKYLFLHITHVKSNLLNIYTELPQYQFTKSLILSFKGTVQRLPFYILGS